MTGGLRFESEPAGVVELLHSVAAMCEELRALGAQVRVSVEMCAADGMEDAGCSTKQSISIPISAWTGLPGLGAPGTLNGAGHMRPPQAGDSLRGERVNGASASHVSTNGNGADCGGMTNADAACSQALGMTLTDDQETAERSMQPNETASMVDSKGIGDNHVVIYPWFQKVLDAQEAEHRKGQRIPQAQLRRMTTESVTELVLQEIRRTAKDGVAPTQADFVQMSNAPLSGLMMRRKCTWNDLVAEAGCVPAQRRKPAKEEMTAAGGRFRQDAATGA